MNTVTRRPAAWLAVVLAVSVAWLPLHVGRSAGAATRERRSAESARRLEQQTRRDLLRVWSEVLRTDPASAIARAQLAGIHLQLARETGDETHYESAERYARESLAITASRNAKSFVTLANALLAQHRFTEAADAAAQAVLADPDEPAYRALAGEIDLELGRYESARANFAQLHRYRGHLSTAARLARWAEVTGRDDYARRLLVEAYQSALRRRDVPAEQLAWFAFRLGDFERRHGKFRRAGAVLNEALAHNPNDYRALNSLAELALQRGRYEEARDYASRASSISRTPETLATLAEALAATGDRVAERSVLEEIRAIVGDEPPSFERAWYGLQLERGVNVAAIASTLDKESRERADVAGLSLFAWALHLDGWSDSARTVIERAQAQGSRDPVLLYRAGVIHAATGERETARRELAAAVNVNPRFNWRHADRARTLLAEMGSR